MRNKYWILESTKEENEEKSNQRKEWIRDGRCPSCGELGKFVNMAPVCSKHGPYDFQKVKEQGKTFEELNEGA